MSERLRVLFLDEGVLGHRTLTAQLKATLADNAAVETTFVTVPPPNRLERLFLRRWKRAGDADMFALRWRLRWSWQVRRLLKRRRRSVDVAFISTQASALLIRGPMRRLPCVLSIDATVGQFTALEYGGPGDAWTPRQQRLLKRLERRALRGAAAVVPWTGWNEQALRREYDMSEVRLATIHPGLDGAWWGRAAAARPGRDEGPLRVLFVGNEVERKGLGTLIDAVGRLEGKAVLDVVSTDPVPESDLVRPHRDVKARTEQLRDLYAAADALALPTRADAVPWVVLEAMAAGLPVVASDVGAIGELLGMGLQSSRTTPSSWPPPCAGSPTPSNAAALEPKRWSECGRTTTAPCRCSACWSCSRRSPGLSRQRVGGGSGGGPLSPSGPASPRWR
jgi:glycosyltransferase involved in cell wall biosynthesis